MSDMAWDVTTDDVQTVVDKHGIPYTQKQLDEWLDESIDVDEIVDNLLQFTSMDNQVNSMHDDIERQLIEAGIIPKDVKRLFEFLEDDWEEEETGEWDEEEDE